jgi:molecular chaperone DnaK
MKIGIDFGTTYTKIAYLDESGNLKLFRYPPVTGREYIPTAVTYLKNSKAISIGDAAREDLANYPSDEASYYDAFKMLLPIDDNDDWKQFGWHNGKSPQDVTADFFRVLLREDANSFEKSTGFKIDSLVVSVPELWQREFQNPGTEVLQRVLTDNLGLPIDHLRSEPVCAASFFVHQYKEVEKLNKRRKNKKFNLLVCDVGGGTFDVALCRVRGDQIDVLDFDGNGQQGLGKVGVRFDREAIKLAYRLVEGKDIDEGSYDYHEFLRAFERVKIDKHTTAQKFLSRKTKTFKDSELYRIWGGRYALTVEQVEEVFEPVKQGIEKVLNTLQKRLDEKNLSVDRVAIVGGFGQFPLVQKTILNCLDIKNEMDVRFDQTLNTENRFFAIAMGAALISNGIVHPVEYYPHTLGIDVFQIKGGRPWDGFLPIVEAGTMPSGNASPHFLRGEDNKPIIVRVEKEAYGQLPIYLKLHGTGEKIILSIPESEYPPLGQYKVGIIVDRSNLGRLVFEPIKKGERREYNLGNVNPVFTVKDD